MIDTVNDKLKSIHIDNVNNNIYLYMDSNNYIKLDCEHIFINEDDIVIYKKSKWGLIIIKDNLIILPDKYDFISKFWNNIDNVKYNNKFGLINKKGEEITPIIYDNVLLNSDKTKIEYVFLDGLKGYVDDNGNIKMERTLKIEKIISKLKCQMMK